MIVVIRKHFGSDLSISGFSWVVRILCIYIYISVINKEMEKRTNNLQTNRVIAKARFSVSITSQM